MNIVENKVNSPLNILKHFIKFYFRFTALGFLNKLQIFRGRQEKIGRSFNEQA